MDIMMDARLQVMDEHVYIVELFSVDLGVSKQSNAFGTAVAVNSGSLEWISSAMSRAIIWLPVVAVHNMAICGYHDHVFCSNMEYTSKFKLPKYRLILGKYP